VIKFPHFMIAKLVHVDSLTPRIQYGCFCSNDFDSKNYTVIDKNNKLIIKIGDSIYWIKEIGYDDFCTINFALNHFFDDYRFCRQMLYQYFNNVAKNCKLIN
jgi:hypothetical protein